MKNFELYPVIAIEGIDGTGKSHAAKELAGHLKGVYFATPSAAYSEARRAFDRPAVSAIARFHFYIGALWDCRNEIITLSRNTPVILDRYILSTRFYHEELYTAQYPGSDNYITSSFNAIAPPAADFTIILNASEDTILRRLNKRKTRGSDRHFELQRTFQKRIKQRFLTSGYPVIHTDNLSAEEAGEKCMNILKENI